MKDERKLVTIEAETRGSFLVVDDQGQRGWIQRRWMTPDGMVATGTVAAKTLKRAIESYRKRQELWREAQEWRNGFHRVTKIARETEKGIGVISRWEVCNIGKAIHKLLWFSKSQLQNGSLPGWLIAARIRETEEDEEMRRYGGVMFVGVDIEDCEDFFSFRR